MTRETAIEMATQFIIVELISEGIKSKESILDAIQNKEVQDRIQMCADILLNDFK